MITMAKKEAAKVELERVYNIPLRKEFQKAPMYKRAKKAGTALKEFIAKHMKTDLEKISVGRHLNMKLWEKGIKRPPHHVKVTLKKLSDGKVEAEIVGAPVEKKEVKKEKEEKKEEASKKEEVPKPEEKEIKEDKPAEVNTGEKKTEEKKVEEKKPVPVVKPEEKKEEPKPVEKLVSEKKID